MFGKYNKKCLFQYQISEIFNTPYTTLVEIIATFCMPLLTVFGIFSGSSG